MIILMIMIFPLLKTYSQSNILCFLFTKISSLCSPGDIIIIIIIEGLRKIDIIF